MSKTIRLTILAAFVAALSLAAPAEAKVVYITYQGTVQSGEDVTGELFHPNTDLTGMAFTSVFTVNTSANSKDDSGPPFMAGRIGGSLVGYESPIQKAVFSIAGKRVDLTGSYYDWAQAYTSGYFAGRAPGLIRDMSSNRFNDGVTIRGSDLLVDFFTATQSPASLTSLFSGTAFNDPLNGYVTSGSVQFAEYNIPSGIFIHDFHAQLTPLSIVVSDSVPEPKAWLSLLVGIGIAGAAIRADRRRTA